jgi:hypothetical protein
VMAQALDAGEPRERLLHHRSPLAAIRCHP